MCVWKHNVECCEDGLVNYAGQVGCGDICVGENLLYKWQMSLHFQCPFTETHIAQTRRSLDKNISTMAPKHIQLNFLETAATGGNSFIGQWK